MPGVIKAVMDDDIKSILLSMDGCDCGQGLLIGWLCDKCLNNLYKLRCIAKQDGLTLVGTRTEISLEARIRLLSDIAGWAYTNTNSWENKLGGQLAYLFWSIAINGCCQWYSHEPIIKLLKGKYPYQEVENPISEDHTIWKYIEILKD